MQSSTHPQLPVRPLDTHKGTFGTALMIGGSRGMSGAIALAGMAALRCGAGLVRLAVPDRILDTVASFDPCYTTIPMENDCMGRLSLESEQELARETLRATAVAIGPGLSETPSLRELVARIYSGLPKTLVVDADGLNNLSKNPELLEMPEGPRILTPHPGEFSRLLGMDRLPRHAQLDIAVEKAELWQAVIVLKGHQTLVTDGKRRYLNTTGNPGMATGGSGDVLTGVITSLVCQGLDAFDASVLGVYLHGLAGDLAAKELGMESMVASDIVRYLPNAFQTYRS